MINDVHGHYEGDIAIKAAARIITACCGKGGICARTGGDEFSVFIRDCDDEKAQDMMKRLSEMTDGYNAGSGRPYRLSMSCGSCSAPAASAEIDELLKVSDARMYEQKSQKSWRRK